MCCILTQVIYNPVLLSCTTRLHGPVEGRCEEYTLRIQEHVAHVNTGGVLLFVVYLYVHELLPWQQLLLLRVRI